MGIPAAATDAGAMLDTHRPALWRLAYQLTGSPAEAEDVVQDTFVRALERWPPADDQHLRGWLVRVATNLAIDLLRRRKRTPYVGPWLPAPVDTDATEYAALAMLGHDYAEPEARYALRESVSYAFLTALEVLTPRQRGVLLLRDVLGYSAREAGVVLSVSEESVRIAHLRARRALAGYDASRCGTDMREATQQALGAFMTCLRQGDVAGLEKLIAQSAVVITDAGGEFNASRVPLVGRERVMRFHLRIARRRAPYAVPEVCSANGMPAIFVRFNDGRPRSAPRGLLRCEVDRDGLIREVHWILASHKIRQFAARGA